MRALKIVTVVMAIMIVAGTMTLGLLIARRMEIGSPHGFATLAEPPGSHITALAAGGDGTLALAVAGAGPDRVLIVDTRSGHVLTRLQLSPPLDPVSKLP